MCGLSYWLLAAGGGSLGGWSRCDVMVVDDGKQGSREAGDCWAGTSDAPRVAAAPSCHRNPFTYYRYTIHIRSFRACVEYILQVHICIFAPRFCRSLFSSSYLKKTYTITKEHSLYQYWPVIT